jgi:pimeloyl-ACP methyl ester carboxylesterase
MSEEVVQLGPGNRLVGILTTPPSGVRDGALACLLMNAGMIHRIGPHRLNVKIARALAGCGIATLRLDLSGVGDSPPTVGGRHFREQAVLDLRDAMDHLELRLGVRRFVVFGLCSGAANGYRLALEDQRVVGTLMFDGFSYPTFRTHLLRRWRRFRSLSWSSLARKIPQWLARRLAPGEAEGGEGEGESEMGSPTREQFEHDMNRLVARGVAIYLVYSGSFLEHYNHASQIRDAFPKAAFLDSVRYDYMPDVDHTVTSLAAQRKVVAAVLEWVQSVAATRAQDQRVLSG